MLPCCSCMSRFRSGPCLESFIVSVRILVLLLLRFWSYLCLDFSLAPVNIADLRLSLSGSCRFKNKVLPLWRLGSCRCQDSGLVPVAIPVCLYLDSSLAQVNIEALRMSQFGYCPCQGSYQGSNRLLLISRSCPGCQYSSLTLSKFRSWPDLTCQNCRGFSQCCGCMTYDRAFPLCLRDVILWQPAWVLWNWCRTNISNLMFLVCYCDSFWDHFW